MVFRNRNVRHPIHQLRDDMDRLITGVLGPWAGAAVPGLAREQPAVNAWELPEALMVEVELPGLKTDQIDISVVGNQLTLKVERPEAGQPGVVYHRRERPVGSLTRVLRLPADVDADRVEAELRDGVLTITLPKAQSAQPRKIQVTT